MLTFLDPRWAPFVAFQKTPSSGVVVNAAVDIWALSLITSPDRVMLQQVTSNIISKLATGQAVFGPSAYISPNY